MRNRSANLWITEYKTQRRQAEGLAIECDCGVYSRWRTFCIKCGKNYPADLMQKRDFVNNMQIAMPDR